MNTALAPEVEETKKAYEEIVRNLDSVTIKAIEAGTPLGESDSSPKVIAARKAWRAAKSA